MESIALVAFAKNPKSEKCKTRLLNELNCTKRVEKTYELLLKITNHTLAEASKNYSQVTSYWAINSKAEDLPNYFSNQISLIPQGSGLLGDRLNTVYTKLKKDHEKVIIIGSDLPFLNTQLIEETVTRLEKHETVIGPSHDGGFYLFSSKANFEKSFWTDVSYSKNNTLLQLLESLNMKTVSFLENLMDIDDLISFTQSVEILSNKKSLLNVYQKDLLEFFQQEINFPNKSFLAADKS